MINMWSWGLAGTELEYNPSQDPRVLHSETLGLGSETCSFNSIPGASGAGVPPTLWEILLWRAQSRVRERNYLVLPWTDKGTSSQGNPRAILKHTDIFNSRGEKKAEFTKLKGATISASQCYSKEMAVLQLGIYYLLRNGFQKSLWSFVLIWFCSYGNPDHII